jgi:hypothetical protein
MRILIIFAVISVLSLAGCSKPTFKVTPPADWVTVTTSTTDRMIYTRDGVALQLIRIEGTPLTQDLPHTKKKLRKDMLPHEVADVVADNFMNDPNLGHQSVLENVPSAIANQNGFLLHVSYQTKLGLRKQAQYCGAIVGDKLVMLLYEAPSRYYFNANLPAFAAVKASFELLPESNKEQ